MLMRRPTAVLVIFVVTWLLILTGVNVYALTLVGAADNGVHTLLLDGHTASAVSARKTRQEVGLLLQQQGYDHQQTENAETRLKVAVQQVEKHMDQTIRSAIAQAADRTVQQLGR
jgi:hypothetical protein